MKFRPPVRVTSENKDNLNVVFLQSILFKALRVVFNALLLATPKSLFANATDRNFFTSFLESLSLIFPPRYI